MSKFAWVENGVIRDLVKVDPYTIFVPEVATRYDQIVPNASRSGDAWDGSILTPAPSAVPPAEPVPVDINPRVSITEFNFLFTVDERISIDASVDPSLVNFRGLLNDPRCLQVDLSKDYIRDYVDYLKTLGLINGARKRQILLGRYPNSPEL